MNTTALVALAKDPERASVKTRLEGSLSEIERKDLYKALLYDCLVSLNAIHQATLFVACYPNNHTSFFKDLSERHKVRTLSQQGNDLGERMLNCVRALEDDYSQILLFGTDTPFPPVTSLMECISSASDWDLLIGPSMDGGYYAIGMKNSHDEIFYNVDWSTDSVMERTMKNARRLDLRVMLAEETIDIDTYDDLKQLARQHLKGARRHSRTASCIRDLLLTDRGKIAL